MDITLGPFTADISVDAMERKPLAEAMGDEAWNAVTKAAGFAPKKAVQGQPAKQGFTISGKLTNVLRTGRSVEVMGKFEIYVDAKLSTLPVVNGRAAADGGATAEDALRAMTEGRIRQILQAIKSGQVTALGRIA